MENIHLNKMTARFKDTDQAKIRVKMDENFLNCTVQSLVLRSFYVFSAELVVVSQGKCVGNLHLYPSV